MSDSILEALVQLFAVVASVRGTKDMGERRSVVYNFLVSQLNKELAGQYIGKFDKYYRDNMTLSLRSENQYKVISRTASRVMRITHEMNKGLSLFQKYVVLVQLYEYLNTGQVSYVEQGLVNDVVVDKFNINREECELVRNFILDTQRVNERVVFSGKDNCEEILEPKHVFWEDLEGEIDFVYLPLVNTFLFKSFGEQHLNMNGSVLTPGRTYIMRAGSSIRNGVSSPIFFYDMMRQVVTNAAAVPLTFEARNVVYKFNKKTVGLHELSFESHSGQLVGIMGISGSGKSTLANVMSGMTPPASGNVYVNNIDIYENPETIKGLIGFVSQDDILMEDLSVYDNLYYSARLSFDNLPATLVQDKIDKLLRLLGLFDIKDIKVGNPLNKKISGGQRKRLNIALELIREPAILILDEPTSGLSSHDSENILELLKDLSINGKLIFVVIHQPSSDIFKMFDQLLILDTGGYLIYDGDPTESLSYFRLNLHMVASREVECPRCGNINVEQILDIISQPIVDEFGNNTQSRKVQPKEWYEMFRWGAIDTSYVGAPEPLPPIQFKTPGRVKQWMIFMARDIKSKLANAQYLLLNLLEVPTMAVSVAALLRYYDVRQGDYSFADNVNMPVFIIVSVIIAFFVGLTVSAEEIIQDRQILKRETFLNLNRRSYIMSKCSQTMLMSALQMLLYVGICNSVLSIRGMFWEYWLVLFTTAVTANLIGLNLSDMMKKTINIYITIPFMVIPQLILSGVFVRFDQMNPDTSSATSVPTYGNVITARWAFEALAVNQFCYNGYEVLFYKYDKAKSQSSYYKDFWVPAMKTYADRVSINSSKAESDPAEIDRLLRIMSDETEQCAKLFPQIAPPRPEIFKKGLFGAAAYNTIHQYLEKVRLHNVSRNNKADMALERHRRQFSPEAMDSLRRNCHNASLADLVTNPSGMLTEVVMEHDGRLWQKNDFVFQDTDKAFGAPLYSPYKVAFGMKIDTYVFDLIIMWVLNLAFLALLLDGRLARWMRK